MSFIILISLFIFTILFIKKYISIDGLSNSEVLIGFLAKLGFGLVFIFIFTYYYGNGFLYGDSANFFNDSKSISLLAYESPVEYIKLLFGMANEKSAEIWPFIEGTKIWEYVGENEYMNDNRLIIKLNSLIHLISGGNIYIHLLFHVVLSFIGILLIYKSFGPYVSRKRLFWWLLILTPSISFWGGGISKESLLILALGLFFFGLIKLIQKTSIVGLLYYLVGVALLLFNKPYVGIIVVPISFVLIIGAVLKFKTVYLGVFSFFITILFCVLIAIPNKTRFTERISFKQQEVINMAQGGVIFMNDSAFCKFDYKYLNHFEKTNDTLIKVLKTTEGDYKLYGEKVYQKFTQVSGNREYRYYLSIKPSASYYETTPILNSRSQLVKNIPAALFNVLARPFPWDNGDKLKFFSFVQNLGLIFLLAFAFLKRKQLNQIEKWLIFIIALSLVFTTLLIGWTTPIFGAAVRYKVPVDLFIIIIAFILLKTKRHEKK